MSRYSLRHFFTPLPPAPGGGGLPPRAPGARVEPLTAVHAIHLDIPDAARVSRRLPGAGGADDPAEDAHAAPQDAAALASALDAWRRSAPEPPPPQAPERTPGSRHEPATRGEYTPGSIPPLARTLGTQIGYFCANPAVSEAGNWGVQMRLKPDVLEDTMLHMTLDSFELRVQFETAWPPSRQHLLAAREPLQAELTGILLAHGTPRDVHILVW